MRRNTQISTFYFIGFILIFCQVILIGQGNIAATSQTSLQGSDMHIQGQKFLNDAFTGKYSKSNSYENAKGSPFLFEEYINGTIITNNDILLENVPIKIDLYRQEIIIKNDVGTELYLNGPYYKKIILPTEDRELTFSRQNPNKPDLFYEVLFENDYLSFYKEDYVTYREARNNGMSKTPSKFTNRVNYYIKQNGEISKVKLKKKQIIKMFSQKLANNMKEYISANNLKMKNEEDFVKLFNETL